MGGAQGDGALNEFDRRMLELLLNLEHRLEDMHDRLVALERLLGVVESRPPRRLSILPHDDSDRPA